MKHRLINFAFIIVVTTLLASAAGAQITINIPGIKKIKKPSVETTTSESATRDNIVPNTNGGSGNWWIDYQLEAIAKYKQQVEGWNPETQVFPKSHTSDDYISLAFSKKERAEWVSGKKLAPNAKLDASLDDLKNSLTRRMPEYTINPKSFTNRNAAEEKLLIADMAEVPGLKIFKIGFNQPTWLTEKNEWGIPKARYKHGMIYGRNPSSEDPFCRIWYINVVQEYSGAGTYGATQARYIEKEYIACPAGQ